MGMVRICCTSASESNRAMRHTSLFQDSNHNASGGMSEGDAIAQDARFRRVEDQQFSVGAGGQRRSLARGLAELGSKVYVRFSGAVGGASDVQHAPIGVHDKYAIVPDREACAG